ncbi:MAG: hypothetical protein EXR08_08475 [Alphaproteobacteria bacterium]|nr:hypothetical protein [Alphaproteobacteria bacterium]
MAYDQKDGSNAARDKADDRALLRLGEPKAYGRVTPEGGLAVFVARNNFVKPVMIVDQAGLQRMMREDERLISRLGQARVARRRSGEQPFRTQHQSLEIRDMQGPGGAEVTVRVNQTESPLGWLASHMDRQGKPLINREQFLAGERLRRDFTLANLSPRVTAVWGLPAQRGTRGGGYDSSSLNDTMIGAKDRVWAAIDSTGPDLGAILLQICCYLHGLAEAEKQLGWPVRAGKVALRIALDRLAAHYGMSSSIESCSGKAAGINGENSLRNKLPNK